MFQVASSVADLQLAAAVAIIRSCADCFNEPVAAFVGRLVELQGLTNADDRTDWGFGTPGSARRTASLTERFPSSTVSPKGRPLLGLSALRPVLGAKAAARIHVSGRASIRPRPWGIRLPRSRELRYRLLACPRCSLAAAVKGGEAVPEGREDRRRSAAEPRTGAPLRAGRRRATCLRRGGVSVSSGLGQPHSLGDGEHSGSLTSAQRWAGHAGEPDAGHLFAPPGRMVGCGHSQAGSVTFSTSPPG